MNIKSKLQQATAILRPASWLAYVDPSGRYSLEYPRNWRVNHSRGVLNLCPPDETGALTISHMDQKVPSLALRILLADVFSDHIAMSAVENIIVDGRPGLRQTYRSKSEPVDWIALIVQCRDGCLMLTVNEDTDRMDARREIYEKILNTVRMAAPPLETPLDSAINRRRSVDPLTAATTDILKPVLTAHGFHPRSRRSFYRSQSPVIQFLSLQLSSYGSREFAVNYSVSLLAPPKEGGGCNFCGRLPGGKKGERWWPSATHQLADESMRDVVEVFLSDGLPMLDRALSLEGFIKSARRLGSFKARDPHLLLDYACALIYKGDMREGKSALSKARAGYASDGRDWCMTYIEYCDELMRAIHEGTATCVLDEWLATSIQDLKLHERSR